MSKKHLGETDAVDEDVSDDAAWVGALVNLDDDEPRRKARDNEAFRLLRRFALTGTPCPPTDLGSLDAPEPDGDLGGDPGPDVHAGDDGVSVVDADESGVVLGGNGDDGRADGENGDQ